MNKRICPLCKLETLNKGEVICPLCMYDKSERRTGENHAIASYGRQSIKTRRRWVERGDE